jgi:hypothetical protein
MIVPGGGLSEDGSRWVACRPGFLMHVNVLSCLFRGRFLAMLVKAHAQDRLRFFGDHAALADRRAFKRFLAPLRNIDWVVYTKNPFAGPEQVLRAGARGLGNPGLVQGCAPEATGLLFPRPWLESLSGRG